MIQKIKILESNIVVQLEKKKSSVIDLIGWFNDHVYVIMNGGQGYDYENVPEQHYKDGLTWPSVGVWYNNQLKGRFVAKPFTYELIKEDDNAHGGT